MRFAAPPAVLGRFLEGEHIMYSFVARQPILDTKQKTVAYELLFRQGLTNAFPKISSEQATTTLISEQFLNQPLESLVGKSLAFINFPYSMLVGGVASCLPADQVVIEILEDATPDDVLLNTVKEMKGSHFRLALDDFVMGSEWERFLPYIDVIKFDFRISKHSDIADYIANHREAYPKLRYLAEKIETNEEFEEAVNMGCSLFQGYFFSRPEIVRQKALTDNQVTITQLLSEVIRDDIDYDKIEMILNRDISLSYKLLRYVNNVRYGKFDPITSFRHAVVYLGKKEMRRFISLVYATSVADNGKSDELSKMSLIRGKFCELLAQKRRTVDPQNAFLCGLLSLLEAMLDRPFREILSQIPIADEIKSALIDKKGELAFYIGLVIDYESLDWQRVSLRVKKLGLSEQEAINLYIESTTWSNKVLLADPSK